MSQEVTCKLHTTVRMIRLFITSAESLTCCNIYRHVPDVIMHLMNSKFTMMDLSRASTAGGDEAGVASSSRRSRACQTQEHWQITVCNTLKRYGSSHSRDLKLRLPFETRS